MGSNVNHITVLFANFPEEVKKSNEMTFLLYVFWEEREVYV